LMSVSSADSARRGDKKHIYWVTSSPQKVRVEPDLKSKNPTVLK